MTEAPPANDVETRRSSGRPRSAQADSAIVTATLDAYVEFGFDAMKLDDIATRAGVSKATIYRRFASKEDLLVAAVESLYTDVELVDTGDLRNDLIALVRQAQQFLGKSRAGEVLPRMLSEVATGTPLGMAYRKRVLEPRFAGIIGAAEAARDRGDLRPTANPDLLVAAVVGPMIFLRLLGDTSHRHDAELAPKLVDVLLAGLAPAAESSRQNPRARRS